LQKTILTLTAMLLSAIVWGQKTEFNLSFNSGLFSFSGESAESTSFINYSSSTNSGYTNNPYGSKNGACYGVSANIKRVSKQGLIVGADLGYENLSSKIFINSISDYSGFITNGYDATGKTLLNYDFINLYPFIGKRFNANKVSFDLTGGIEFAYCLATKENGNATATNGTKYTTAVERKTIKTDTRPRIQFSAGYQNMGVYIGYSYGLANYMEGYVGGINECYARLIRFGLTYQIK
jgi:hypothetical protein